MASCKDCIHRELCNVHGYIDADECGVFKNKADVVKVVRCKDCIYSQELDKHCEINCSAYRHCNMWRGEEEKNVWHSYKKYRKDYSIVELDGFCDMGERRAT